MARRALVVPERRLCSCRSTWRTPSSIRLPARPGIVARTDLVDDWPALARSPVISVVAPPGYGKTTLLAQWAERTASRVGWISADVQDNDPTVLLTYVAVALHRIEGIDPAVFRTIAASGAEIKGPRRLAAAMAGMRPTGRPSSSTISRP